jgi:hypothetical protein
LHIIFYGADWKTNNRTEALIFFWNNVGYTNTWAVTHFYFDSNNLKPTTLSVASTTFVDHPSTIPAWNKTVGWLNESMIVDLVNLQFNKSAISYSNKDIYYVVGDKYSSYCRSVDGLCIGNAMQTFCQDSGKGTGSHGNFYWGIAIEPLPPVPQLPAGTGVACSWTIGSWPTYAIASVPGNAGLIYAMGETIVDLIVNPDLDGYYDHVTNFTKANNARLGMKNAWSPGAICHYILPRYFYSRELFFVHSTTIGSMETTTMVIKNGTSYVNYFFCPIFDVRADKQQCFMNQAGPPPPEADWTVPVPRAALTYSQPSTIVLATRGHHTNTPNPSPSPIVIQKTVHVTAATLTDTVVSYSTVTA